MFHVKQGRDARPCVSRETLARLETYAALLLKWNRTINLISPRDEARLWPRHIDDCLNLLPLLPPDFAFAVDLGSGAGFPGLVLSIATGRPFHLVEADQRKAAFLREAARATGAPSVVHQARIEDFGIRDAPLVTARALAPLATLLQWAAPILAADGLCLFPKGRTHAAELTAAARQWQMRTESIPSQSDPDAVILRIRDIQRV
jgi:16S rRNA (guanine(527)-N(7))-methyltransferase RsmG